MEHLNPGGSIKDRASKYMVEEAEKTGKLKPGGTIIEGTGGNTGISLALIALSKGYKTILTMPDKVSPEKVALMKQFGARVELAPTVAFDNPAHYYWIAERLSKEHGYVWTNQFENTANFRAHIEGTGPEIWRQTQGQVDAVICSSGTGGTIAGLSTYLKSRNADCKAFVIDPPGSGLHAFITTGKFESSGTSLTEGIGIMRKTANFAKAKVDGSFQGSDQEVVDMAHYLLQKEGLFLGASAALNVVGCVKLARKLGPGKTIVTVSPDAGERARSKLWNSEYLKEKNLLVKPEQLDASLEWISKN
jgi:cysteine synthase A